MREGLNQYLGLLAAATSEALTYGLLYLVAHFGEDRDRVLATARERTLSEGDRSRLGPPPLAPYFASWPASEDPGAKGGGSLSAVTSLPASVHPLRRHETACSSRQGDLQGPGSAAA